VRSTATATRIAAIGDVHFGLDSADQLRPHLEHLPAQADVFLLAGDLTKCGHPDEATVLARELESTAEAVPTFAVLGNHDFHSDEQILLAKILESAGVRVLEGEGDVVTVGTDGVTVGVAGVKGFGGGFAGACGSEFGEPEMKAFMRHTRDIAGSLESSLLALADEEHADVRIALMHYAPVDTTLRGERLEIYPFLGSYLLAEAVDRAGADLVVHGHAHGGSEKGVTPGGVHVRNVALPVVKQAYSVYELGKPGQTG
jgi:Icc-related predicted phosphoesterase